MNLLTPLVGFCLVVAQTDGPSSQGLPKDPDERLSSNPALGQSQLSKLSEEELESRGYRYYKRGRRGDHDIANLYFTEWIRRNGSVRKPYHLRAYSRMDKGDLRGAVDDFTKALKIEPRSVEDLSGRALANRRLNDFTGAIRDLDEVLKLEPNHAHHRVQRAEVYEAANRTEEAIAEMTRAVRMGQTGEDPGMTAEEIRKAIERLAEMKAELENRKKGSQQPPS